MKTLVTIVITSILILNSVPLKAADERPDNIKKTVLIYGKQGTDKHFIKADIEGGQMILKECFGSIEYCELLSPPHGFNMVEAQRRLANVGKYPLSVKEKLGNLVSHPATGTALGLIYAGGTAGIIRGGDANLVLLWLVGVPVATPLLIGGTAFIGGGFAVLASTYLFLTNPTWAMEIALKSLKFPLKLFTLIDPSIILSELAKFFARNPFVAASAGMGAGVGYKYWPDLIERLSQYSCLSCLKKKNQGFTKNPELDELFKERLAESPLVELVLNDNIENIKKDLLGFLVQKI